MLSSAKVLVGWLGGRRAEGYQTGRREAGSPGKRGKRGSWYGLATAKPQHQT